MKYLLLNDINFLIKKEKKILLLYFIISILLTILYSKFYYDTQQNEFIKILGLNCVIGESNWLEILSYIFYICIFVYLSFKIFVKDMINNLENIFLRMSVRKWFAIKIFTILLISFIVLLANYFIVISIILLISKVSNLFFFLLFIKNLIYIFCLQFILLIIYSLFNTKYNKVSYILIVVILYLILVYKYIFSIININIIVMLSLTVLIFLIFSKKIVKSMKIVFEIVKEK